MAEPILECKWIFDENVLEGYPSYNKNFSESQDVPYPKYMLSINLNKLEGYPSLYKFKDFTTNIQEVPYPRSIPKIVDDILEGYPSTGNIKFHITQGVPYPKYMPKIVDDILEGYPSTGNIKFHITQERPFPRYMFGVTGDILEGYPSFELKGGFETFGVFSETPSLETVVIPKSVKYIADFTFHNSAIKKIKIAKDCVYGKHTFPEGCKIEFYE